MTHESVTEVMAQCGQIPVEILEAKFGNFMGWRGETANNVFQLNEKNTS